MKNLKLIHLKVVMAILLFVWTIVAFIVIFKNIVGIFTVKIVAGYIIYLLIFFIYLLADSLNRLRSLSKADIKNRVFKFIICFVTIMVIDLILYYITKAKGLFLVTSVPISIGLSLGVSLFDLPFTTKTNEEDKFE